MTSPYYVKVYFTKQQQQQQQQPEIRRFALDISPENNIYQDLCTKIATYQPDIQLHGYTLQYIDDENERITFSSTEELRSAISTNKDINALKIFVTVNQPTTTTTTTTAASASASNKEQHVGVECDGCKGSIVGFRYKCVVCLNYDLCEKCSSEGVHSEHDMIKISKPGNFYHPYGPRHHNRRHRFSPPTPPSLFPNGDFFEQIQTQIPQWLPNRENTAHFRTHMQHHIDNIKTNTQAHMQHSRQYLENVGQYLQQTLSPFGIDCEYRVDGQAASTNDNSAQSEPSAVPKTSNTTTETNQQQNGISSLLNMFRGSGVSSSSTTTQANSPNETGNSSGKNVEECVEKLKAMGFDEKDESLMELIRSKQGDLNSVLDEINTRQQ